MANWTGLAGAAGLAAALEEIQGRRVREGELQRKLTEGQGEWTPATGGMGGPLGFFDALLGYNKPGQIGFGGQRYQFQPYPTMTEQDAQRLQLTTPETTTTPAYEKPLPPNVQGPLELVPEQETTREVPLPGFVGRQRMTPEFLKQITMEQLQEKRDRAKQLREQAFWTQLNKGQGGTGPGAGDILEGTFDLGGGATGTTGTTGTPATTGATGTTAAQPAGGPVPGIDKLSPQFRGKAQLVANRLGINLDDFYRVMHFETGGEFSPATKNRMGSGATGLIQFTEETAKGLGTTTAALAQMTPEQQLDYVEKHLAPHKGKMGNLKDLFMAVLYPAAVGKPENTVLFTPDKTPKAYLQNAGLDRDKKGYVTVGDAVAAVQRTTGGAPPSATAQAPATATAQAPAAAPSPAATDPATQTYTAQFRKGSEADALKTIAAAEDKANPKNPTDQATLVAMKRALDTVFPRGQAQAQTQPDTSMQVAGPGAPAPKTTTTAQTTGAVAPQVPTAPPTTTAQVPPTTMGTTTATEAFQLKPETRSAIEGNNRQIIGINAKLRDVRTRQEQLLNSPAAGTPRGTVFLQKFAKEIDELEKDKNKLRDNSQTLRDKDFAEYGKKGTKVEEEVRGEQKDIRTEERKAPLAGEVKASEMNVTTDPELRNLTRDLADKGIVGNADYNKNSESDKAIVIRTATKYADNKALVANLDNFSKAALSQILKDDNTPLGEVSAEQMTRAREQGAARIKQQKDDEIEAARLAKLNEPMKEFALKYFNHKKLRVADGTMTAPEAEKLGYRLTPVENQKTLMAADNSISSINRVYTLLFGGDDPDGSITGTVGQKFDGIYPTLEKGRTDTQSVIARTKMTMQLKKGIFQGTDIGQSASALQKYIQGTLGALSRDLGGERGHFTDFDARRIQGLFQDLQTGMFQVGPMTSSGEAKKLMRSIVATISDRVRTSGSLRREDPLPWNVSGERRTAPQAGGTATGTTQEPVRTPPTAQETVPTPPVTQETAPEPVAPTSQRPNAPAAAQPAQRLEQLTTQYPPAQYGGKKITDPVTGIRYRSDGTAWREIQ